MEEESEVKEQIKEIIEEIDNQDFLEFILRYLNSARKGMGLA